jgi:hypothetical protein
VIGKGQSQTRHPRTRQIATPVNSLASWQKQEIAAPLTSLIITAAAAAVVSAAPSRIACYFSGRTHTVKQQQGQHHLLSLQYGSRKNSITICLSSNTDPA